MLYLNPEVEPDLFEALRPHRRGVGCLYVKRLDAVDEAPLRREPRKWPDASPLTCALP